MSCWLLCESDKAVDDEIVASCKAVRFTTMFKLNKRKACDGTCTGSVGFLYFPSDSDVPMYSNPRDKVSCVGASARPDVRL